MFRISRTKFQDIKDKTRQFRMNAITMNQRSRGVMTTNQSNESCMEFMR